MSTQNTLQGILSQKIVQSDGVYSAKTDIVNVDSIKLDSTSTQAGKIVFTSGASTSIATTVPGVTSNSVVILTPNISLTGTYTLTTTDNTITIAISNSQNITFNYFVAKY